MEANSQSKKTLKIHKCEMYYVEGVSMNIGLNQTSFGAAYVSKKGLEEVKQRPFDHIERVVNTVENAKNSIATDFIIDDNGRYFVKHPQYGEVRVSNPSSPQVDGKVFSCRVEDKEGNKKTIGITLPTEREARSLKENEFYCGAYMPNLNLALYNALEAEAAYKNNTLSKLEDIAQ